MKIEKAKDKKSMQEKWLDEGKKMIIKISEGLKRNKSR